MSLCKYSAEPSRRSAYPCDVRWRIVYQQLGKGLSCRDVVKHLNVDQSTASRIVSRFDETGSVDPTDRKGVPSKLSNYDENIIIENLLVKPGMYYTNYSTIFVTLQEHKQMNQQFVDF